MNEYRGILLNVSLLNGEGSAQIECWYTAPEEGTAVKVVQEFQLTEPEESDDVNDWARQLLIALVEQL